MTEKEAKKACAKFLELKSQMLELEKELAGVQADIVPFLESQPSKSYQVNGWELKYVWTEDKESFRLSDAKENIDGRVLAPYISKSSFGQIRRTFKGGKKSAP